MLSLLFPKIPQFSESPPKKLQLKKNIPQFEVREFKTMKQKCELTETSIYISEEPKMLRPTNYFFFNLTDVKRRHFYTFTVKKKRKCIKIKR